ncbi:hypothetical protein Tco_0437876 [Tanacetum coccineum]
MTKQGNFTQRTPQAKKQSDQASRQVSKQASGSTNAPHDLVFPATGPSLGTTQPTATITSTEDLRVRSSSESPPSSDSEDSRRKRRRRVSVSSEDTSDNEDAETRHWKSKNRYREDEDMSLPWRRQKVDAFARDALVDFPSEDKRRRHAPNLKTYDGTVRRGGRGTTSTPTNKTPKEILATEFQTSKTTQSAHPEEQRAGNGSWREVIGRRVILHNECVHLLQLNCQIGQGGQLESPGRSNIKEGKDKQRGGGKKDAPRDKADTIYMVQPWQRKTKQKVSQKFSQGAAGHDIHRMYIDGGASADILYEHCFQRLRPEVKSQLNPATTSLTGFTGEKIWPMGQLRLPVIVGNKEHSTTAWMNFMVLQITHPHTQAIIGRPGISAKTRRFPSNGPRDV